MASFLSDPWSLSVQLRLSPLDQPTALSATYIVTIRNKNGHHLDAQTPNTHDDSQTTTRGAWATLAPWPASNKTPFRPKRSRSSSSRSRRLPTMLPPRRMPKRTWWSRPRMRA